MAFQESNRLQFTNYVDEDCRVLSERGSAPHDSLIPHLIHSQELMDDLRSISGVCDGDNSPAPDGIRALNLRRIFRKRLQILEQSFSRVAWSNSESFRGLYSATYADRFKVALRLDLLYLKCCIEELVSQASDPVGIHSTVDIPIHQHWYTATARTDSIVSCFSAAMTFIETFCNLTVEGHRRVTILEYTRCSM